MSDGMTDSSRGYHVRPEEPDDRGPWKVTEYRGHPDFRDHVSVWSEGRCGFTVNSISEGYRLAELLNRTALEDATKPQLLEAIKKIEREELEELERAELVRKKEIEAAKAVLRKHNVRF